MIPLEIFHSQNSEEKYRHLVEDAVAANMNMLRIWGGGLYQLDSFYDIADEMGVLIWQEAMFACAQYPRDSEFLSNVSISPPLFLTRHCGSRQLFFNLRFRSTSHKSPEIDLDFHSTYLSNPSNSVAKLRSPLNSTSPRSP